MVCGCDPTAGEAGRAVEGLRLGDRRPPRIVLLDLLVDLDLAELGEQRVQLAQGFGGQHGGPVADLEGGEDRARVEIVEVEAGQALGRDGDAVDRGRCGVHGLDRPVETVGTAGLRVADGLLNRHRRQVGEQGRVEAALEMGVYGLADLVEQRPDQVDPFSEIGLDHQLLEEPLQPVLQLAEAEIGPSHAGHGQAGHDSGSGQDPAAKAAHSHLR